MNHLALEDMESTEQIVLQYKVLNLGYFTWPVKQHLGTIVFSETTECHENDDDDESHSTSTRKSVHMEWIVEWTLLWMPVPYWPDILKWIHTQTIAQAANHIMTRRQPPPGQGDDEQTLQNRPSNKDHHNYNNQETPETHSSPPPGEDDSREKVSCSSFIQQQNE